MLQGIHQKTKGLLPEINEYGCLFLCFAEVSAYIFTNCKEDIEKLNSMWTEAKERGFIDKDNVIVEHNSVANKIFNLNVMYDNIHHSPDEKVPDDVKYMFGYFEYKQGHFVVIDRDKNVTHDSIYGGSNTVRYGKLKTTRWYHEL